MTVDATTLRRKVGASATVPEEDLASLVATAAALVSAYIGESEVPDEVLERAHLLVAVEMFHQDRAPNGIVNQQYATGDGSGATPVRVARDPLVPAYPVLARWVSSKGWVG